MTQEDKQLLIKDLCGRLPYSVWGLHRGEDLPLYVIDNSGAYMVLGYNAWFNLDTVDFKPYLRPMSSMTDEEKKTFNKYIGGDNTNWYLFDDNLRLAHGKSFYTIQCSFSLMDKIINFLLVHHFDYHGLIERGLAIEVTEENNPYK